MTDLASRRKLLAQKLSRTWSMPSHVLNLPVSGKGPLELWVAPKEITQKAGYSSLNWSSWIRHPQMAAQSSGLLRLSGADPSFCLWKHVEANPSSQAPVASCREIVPEGERLRLCEQLLEGQTVDQVLRDEKSGEGRRKLVTDAKTRLASARHVYVKFDDGGEEGPDNVDAMLLVGEDESLKLSFRHPSSALQMLQTKRDEVGAEKIVYVDLMLSNRCPQKQAGHTLLSHVFAMHPRSLFVVHCPMVLSTLQFYSNHGFTYNDTKSDSRDLSLHVIDFLSSVVSMWHSGYPALTYLSSAIEATRVRLSAYDDFHAARNMASDVRHIDLNENTNLEQDVERFLNEGHDKIWIWLPSTYSSNIVPMAVAAAHIGHELMAHDWRIDYVALVGPASFMGDVAHAVLALPLPSPTNCILEPPVNEDDSTGYESYEAFASSPTSSSLSNSAASPVRPFSLNVSPYASPSYASSPHASASSAFPSSPLPYEDFTPSALRDPATHQADVVREYFYNSKTRLLKRARVSELIEFMLHERNLLRRDMTVDMRNVFSVLFEDMDIVLDRSLKGVAFVRRGVQGLDAISYACVFHGESGMITHLHCTDDDDGKLFALMLRIQRPNDVELAPEVVGCGERMQVWITRETRETLFETVVTHATRRAFVNSCLFRNTPPQKHSSRNSPLVSICKGRQRTPTPGR